MSRSSLNIAEAMEYFDDFMLSGAITTKLNKRKK